MLLCCCCWLPLLLSAAVVVVSSSLSGVLANSVAAALFCLVLLLRCLSCSCVGVNRVPISQRVSMLYKCVLTGCQDLTDLTVAVNTRITPPVLLHNPYSRVFHVKEVFTTENFLHLTLPQVVAHAGFLVVGVTPLSQKDEAKTDGTKLWQLEPHETKCIINLSFLSTAVGTFNGFVHIKTEEQDMILPVDIRAVAFPLLSVTENLSFGTITSPNTERIRTLTLSNVGSTPVAISNIRTARPDSRMRIDFQKVSCLSLSCFAFSFFARALFLHP